MKYIEYLFTVIIFSVKILYENLPDIIKYFYVITSYCIRAIYSVLIKNLMGEPSKEVKPLYKL